MFPPPLGAVARVAVFLLLGFRIATAGPRDLVLLGCVGALWAAAAAATLGPRKVATWSMFAVGATVPMNGVRAGGGLALSDVFLVIAGVSLIADSIVRPHRQHDVPAAIPATFGLGLAMVVLGGALGTFFADDPLPSIGNLLRFALSAVVPLFVLRGWRPDGSTLRRYAWCWVGGAVASGLLALTSHGEVGGRPGGLATHPNHLAIISTLGAGLALALVSRERGWRRWAAVACSGVLALSVVRAGSRAGLIALVVAGAVVAVRSKGLRPPRRRPGIAPLAVCGLALVGVALFAGNAIQVGQHNAIRRVFGDKTSSASDQERTSLLQAGLHSIGERPLTGSGFQKALQAHNIYVQVWASAGLLGIVGFLVLALTVVRAGLSVPSRSSDGWLATGFVAGYVGYLAAGVVQNFLWDRYLWLHVAAIVWLAVDHRGAGRSPRPARNRSRVARP